MEEKAVADLFSILAAPPGQMQGRPAWPLAVFVLWQAELGEKESKFAQECPEAVVDRALNPCGTLVRRSEMSVFFDQHEMHTSQFSAPRMFRVRASTL